MSISPILLIVRFFFCPFATFFGGFECLFVEIIDLFLDRTTVSELYLEFCTNCFNYIWHTVNISFYWVKRWKRQFYILFSTTLCQLKTKKKKGSSAWRLYMNELYSIKLKNETIWLNGVTAGTSLSGYIFSLVAIEWWTRTGKYDKERDGLWNIYSYVKYPSLLFFV